MGEFRFLPSPTTRSADRHRFFPGGRSGADGWSLVNAQGWGFESSTGSLSVLTRCALPNRTTPETENDVARSRKQQAAWEGRQEARIQSEFEGKVEQTALKIRQRFPDLTVQQAFRQAEQAVGRYYPGRSI